MRRVYQCIMGVLVVVLTVAGCAQAQRTENESARLELAGSGNKSTEKFTVGAEWTVEWSYECSEQIGALGMFWMWPRGNDEKTLLPVMSTPATAKAGDTQHYHEAGEFYLDIQSNCDWNIVVRG